MANKSHSAFCRDQHLEHRGCYRSSWLGVTPPPPPAPQGPAWLPSGLLQRRCEGTDADGAVSPRGPSQHSS